MKKEEVKKLFQTENFLAELNKVDSMESLRRLLANNGVNLSLEQMETAISQGANRELTEYELCAVSGGVVFKWLKFAWDCFMFNPMQVY